MKHIDLFSGIGGFSLAASWVWGDDHEIVSFVEIDKFCQKVLKKHWPDVPIIEDIKDCTYERIFSDPFGRRRWEKWQQGSVGRLGKKQANDSMSIKESSPCGSTATTKIDLLTGGFPCQPYSVAGKQRGAKDDRALWPQMLRVIREVRPTWVIGENVAGIINMEFDQVLSDLEGASYETQAFLIPACGVDAPHRRDRVWIVAHSNGERQQKQRLCLSTRFEKESYEATGSGQDVANPFSIIKRKYGFGWPSGISWWQWEPAEIIQAFRALRREETRLPELESELGRVANGIPNRVDRLKSLGNAILPQCVVPIMQAIKEIEENETLSNRK